MDEKRLLLIFDGDCAFCRLWIAYLKEITGERAAYRPYQEAAGDYPNIPRKAFKKRVQLILPDESRMTAAQAVFRVLVESPGYGALWWFYQHLPGFAAISEWLYALVAAHRDMGYRLTTFLIGKPAVASYRLARWLFMRAIGLVYLIAFASLIPQITGLIGANGILPVHSFLDSLQGQYGPRVYGLLPTIFWLSSSDAMLVGVCVAGAIIGALVMIGMGQRLGLIVLYGLYLSILYAGQDFLSFQWDILLLEAGFLAIWLAPGHWLPRWPSAEPEPPRGFIWLARWLLFRLLFGSGMVKLQSGDPTWRGLTALDYHFYTQPLPTPLGWVIAQLPSWAHQVMTATTFGVELVMPFCIFLPRRLRAVGGCAIIAFQIMIALTGNYTFFNVLTIALCIPLFDDMAIRRLLPARLRQSAMPAPYLRAVWKRAAPGIVGGIIFMGSGTLFIDQLSPVSVVPAPLYVSARTLSRYGIVNTYGLFAVMSTSRQEIVIEGSNDGVTWLAYEFTFKPGDTRRAPPWVAPHQPRLDWQMWFAALGSYQNNPWFVNLMFRLLKGQPEVLALLANNPFPARPPKFIRAILYDYTFTDVYTLQKDGTWWTRSEEGLYFPEASIDQFR